MHTPSNLKRAAAESWDRALRRLRELAARRPERGERLRLLPLPVETDGRRRALASRRRR